MHLHDLTQYPDPLSKASVCSVGNMHHRIARTRSPFSGQRVSNSRLRDRRRIIGSADCSRSRLCSSALHLIVMHAGTGILHKLQQSMVVRALGSIGFGEKSVRGTLYAPMHLSQVSLEASPRKSLSKDPADRIVRFHRKPTAI